MSWYDNAIIYHIYPLGFCGAPKINDGGEIVYRLDKVLDWIDHFKEMNVDAVYFGPVFESAEHGYDTTDYKMIDRRLGDNNSFRNICNKLHENGIKVILDGVFNHVGRNFPQFRDVCEHGQNSGYCGWFQNLNFGGRSPYGDNFWYEGWNGHYNLVKLNLRNVGVCDHIIDAINYWIEEFKIDGIRFDAADCIDFDFFRRIRSFCKGKNPEFWLMGEIIHGDYKRWANSEMLDSVTNYECYKGLYSSHNEKNYFEINYSINRQSGDNGIYKGINLYNFVDNHDVNRLASTLTKPEYLPLVYTLLYTMPGIPSIYYGSEYGIKGCKENNSDDNLRPCLDLNNIPDADMNIYAHITKLGKIYKACESLRIGQYHTVIIRNQQLLFSKELNGKVMYVALNLDENEYELSFGTQFNHLTDLLTGNEFKVNNGNISIKMPPFTSMILAEENIDLGNNNCNENIFLSDKNSDENANQPTEIVIGAKYRHFKGNEYEVIAEARHSETLEELVVYKALYGNAEIWARPKSMFIGMAGDKRRFTKI